MYLLRDIIKTPMMEFSLLVFVQLVFVSPSQGGDQCTDQLPLNNCWETKNIIDERIDVYAQKALIKMFNTGGAQTASASAILCAVKRGDLGGIYIEDQMVPALRARDAGSGWWKILNGKESVCYKIPSDKKPIIVLSSKIKGNTDKVSDQISISWSDCNIRSSEKRCYKQTIGAGDTTLQRECDINRDCEMKYGPNYECDTIKKLCVYKFGIEITPGPCTGQGECTYDTQCESRNCISIPNRCGRCFIYGSAYDGCITKASAVLKEDISKCDEAQKKDTFECARKIAECTAKCLTRGPGCIVSKECPESVLCGTGGPAFKREKCNNEAYKKQGNSNEKCKEHLY